MIRVKLRCILGKPGTVIAYPTKEQLAWAKANPSIARIIRVDKTPAPKRALPEKPSVIPAVPLDVETEDKSRKRRKYEEVNNESTKHSTGF